MAGSNNRITAAELIAQANIRRENTNNALNVAGSSGTTSDNIFNKQMGITNPVNYLNEQHNLIAGELMQALDQGLISPQEVQHQLSTLNPAVAGEISNMLFGAAQPAEPTTPVTQDDSVWDLQNPQDVAMQRMQARLQAESAKVLNTLSNTANQGLTAAKQALLAVAGTVSKASEIHIASQAKKAALDPQAVTAQVQPDVEPIQTTVENPVVNNTGLNVSQILDETVDKLKTTAAKYGITEESIENTLNKAKENLAKENTTPEPIQEELPVLDSTPVETVLEEPNPVVQEANVPEPVEAETAEEESDVLSEEEQTAIFNELVTKAQTQTLDEFLVESSDYVSPLDAAKIYSEVQLGVSQENLAKVKEEIRLTSPRYASEVATDTLTSTAKGGVLIGEALYGLVNAATLNRLENTVGIGGALNVSREWLNDQMSDQTKYSRQQSAAQLEAVIAEEMDKLDAKKVNGVNSVFDYARAASNLVAGGAFSLLDNPLALADTVLESAVAFAVPAGFAAATRAKLLSAIPAAERAAFLASKGNELEKKVQLAALVGIASMEAGATSNQLQQRILGMSEAELMQYDKYRNMIADNVDPELAKQSLAADASIIAYGLTALGAGTVSKLVGSDAVAAGLSRGLTKLGEGTQRTIKAGINQTFEEGLQGPVSEIASNVANLAVGKDNQNIITPEVATSAGQGAVSGLISGTGTAGVISAFQSTAKGVAQATESLDKLSAEAKVSKAIAQSVSATGFNETLYKTVSDGLAKVTDNPVPHIAALKGLLEGVGKNKELLNDPKQVEVIERKIAEIKNRIQDSLFAESEKKAIQDNVRSVMGLAADAPITKEIYAEYRQRLTDDPDLEMAEMEAIMTAVEKIEETPNYEKVNRIQEQTDIFFKAVADNILSKKEVSEEEVSTLLRAFGSAPMSFSTDDYQKLMATEAYQNAPAQTKAELGAAYELKKFLTDDVNATILEGGKNDLGPKGSWIGINNYLNTFNRANGVKNLASMVKQRDALANWYNTYQKPKSEEFARKTASSEKQAALFSNVAKEAELMKKTLNFMDKAIAAAGTAKPVKRTKVSNTPVNTNQDDATSTVELNADQVVAPNISEEAPSISNTPETSASLNKQEAIQLVKDTVNEDTPRYRNLIKGIEDGRYKTIEEIKTILANTPDKDKKVTTRESTAPNKKSVKRTKKEEPKANKETVANEETGLSLSNKLKQFQVTFKGGNPSKETAFGKLIESVKNKFKSTKHLNENPVLVELADKLIRPEGMSLDEAFAWLNKHGSENQKLVAELIKKLAPVNQVKKVVLGFSDDPDGSKSGGYYDAKQKTVHINLFVESMANFSNEGNANYMVSTMLHEFIHAATYDLIARQDEFGEQIRSEIAALSETINNYINSLPKEEQGKYETLRYGANDVQELIAVIFGEADLLNQLADIPNPKVNKRTLKAQIKAIISKITSALFGLLNTTNQQSKAVVDAIAIANKLFSEAAEVQPSVAQASTDAASDNIENTTEEIPVFDFSFDPIEMEISSNTEASDIEQFDLQFDEAANDNAGLGDYVGTDPSEAILTVLEDLSNGSIGNVPFNTYFGLGKLTETVFIGENAIDLVSSASPENVHLEILERLELEQTPENIAAAIGFVNTVRQTYKGLLDINFGSIPTKESSINNYVLERPLSLLSETVNGVQKLPTAVAEQMAIGMAIELASNYAMTRSKTDDKTLRRILNLPKDAPILTLSKELRNAGFAIADVKEALVRQVFNQLGLNMSKTVTSRQIDSVAEHIALTMLTAATVGKNPLLLTTLQPLPNGNQMRFYRINPNWIKEGSSFVSLLENTNFLNKVSGDTNLFKEPVTEEPTLGQIRKRIRTRNLFKRSAKLDKKTRKRLLKHSSVPNGIFQDTQAVFSKLAEKAQELVFGVVPDSLLNRMHFFAKESAEAKNESQKRELSRFKEFSQRTGEGIFYWIQSMVSNGRYMTDNTFLDPQGSKATRHMMGATASLATVDTKASEDNIALLEFKKAVLQAFDQKPDQKTHKEIDLVFDEIVNNPVLQKALDLMNEDNAFESEADLKVLENVLYNTDNSGLIADGATAGFHALVGLAAYREALKTGSSFSTTLRYEIDGKTNGTAHTLLDWFAADSQEEMAEFMERVGIYTAGDIQTFRDFKTQGKGKDHYEYFANKLEKALLDTYMKVKNKRDAESNAQRKQLKAISVILGFDGTTFKINRSLAKQPLMTLIYGAGTYRVTNYFIKDVISNFYQSIADIQLAYEDRISSPKANKDAALKAAVKQLDKVKQTIRDLILSSQIDPNTLDEPKAKKAVTERNKRELALLETELADLTPETALIWNLGNLQNTFESILQEAFQPVFEAGLNSAYGTLVTKRNEVLKSVELSYSIFSAIYRKRYQEKLNEINSELETPVNSLTYLQQQDLINQLAAENLLPILEGQSLKGTDDKGQRTGIVAIKTKMGSAIEAMFYRNFSNMVVEAVVNGEVSEYSVSFDTAGDQIIIDGFSLSNTNGVYKPITLRIFNAENKLVEVSFNYRKTAKETTFDSDLKISTLLKAAGYNPASLTESQVQVGIDSSNETRYSKGSGTELIIAPPGVSTLVNLTHERDGTNQGLGGMDGNLHFLNVHDASYLPVGIAASSMVYFNKAFFDIHYNGQNSILAHRDMVQRMIEIADKEGIPYNADIGLEVRGDTPILRNIVDLLTDMGLAAQADKIAFMDTVTSVNQFADPDAVYAPKANERTNYEPKDIANGPVQTLGSSPKGVNQFTAQESVNVDQTNVVKIFDNINTTVDPVQISNEHENYLGGLVKEVIAPVVGELKLLIEDTSAETKGVLEERSSGRIIKLQRGSFAPTFGMSRKEVLAHELVHAILSFPLSLPSRYKNRLENLYDIAREYLKPSLFLGAGPHSQAELDAAQELYDYIFNNQQQQAVDPYYNVAGLVTNQRMVNNGMHEFAAYGLTNEKVIKALNKLFQDNPAAREKFIKGEPFRRVKSKPNSTAFTKLVDFTNDLFNYFAFKVRQIFDRIDGLNGKEADQALYLLATKLTYLEGTLAAQEMKLNTFMGKANQKVRQAVMFGIKGIGKGVDKVKNVGAQNLAVLADTATSSSLGLGLQSMFDKLDLSKDNLLRGLVVEMIGATAENSFARDLLLQSKEFIDKGREFVSSSVKTYVNRNFTEELSQEESASLTRVVLDLDLVAAFNGNVADLAKLLNDPIILESEIRTLEAQITNLSANAHNYILTQAKSTGYYLVHSGFPHQGNGLFNAYQIANLDGLGMRPDFNVSEVLPLIDKLITLYGIREADEVDLNRSAEVFNREPDAVQKLLDVHKQIKEQAQKRLFQGQDRLVRKNYTREQLDPFVGYVVVPESEVQQYRNDGFRVVALEKAKDDPNQEKVFVVFGESLAMETHQRGVVSTRNLAHKGANLFQNYSQLDSDDPSNSAKAANDVIKINRRRTLVNKAMNKPNFKFTGTQYLAPVYNPKGVVVDYRYEMSPSMKREVLNKREMIDEVLGLTAASTLDKKNTSLINTRAVAGMYSVYKTYGAYSDTFIKVGKDSKNKEDRDMWYLMPEEARQQARALFGGDYVMVRKDDYRMWFGGRKPNLATLANWLDKKTQNTILEQTGNALANALRHRWASIAFDSWVDIVALAKERIVILNTAVLSQNIMSNTILLFMSGLVNPAKIISYQVEGYNLLKKYERDHIEAMQISLQLSDSTLSDDDKKSLTAKIKILEDRMATNPVTPLIDRGMYQTIIEDAVSLDDTYGYANKLERKFENITNRIPDVVKDIGNTVFMTKASSTNQMLRDAASMSDFAARYALFKHRTQTGTNFEDAFNDAMESFITYELPTNIHIQWMNDVGLAMFTKFFLRSQKIIFRRFRDNPLNMAAFYGLEYFTDNNYSDIADTHLSPQNVLNRFYSADDIIKAITETNLITFATR